MDSKTQANANGDNEGIVFISYSSKDENYAKDIHERLSQQLPCFLASEDIKASTNWISELARALQSSWVVLLLITPNSMESKYVLKELTVAVSNDIPIYPIRLSRTELSEELEFLLSTHHIKDYAKYEWPKPVQFIIDNISALYEEQRTARITDNANKLQSRDRQIRFDRNILPDFVQVFEWIEPDVSKEVETAVKSLPLPKPLESGVDPGEWIQKFQQPFTEIIQHDETKEWLQDHFYKLAYGQRGLTSFTLCDATLSVPPLKKVFAPLVKMIQQTWKAGIFAKTGTGKSRLLTYLAHYWRKKRDRPVFFIDHPQGIFKGQWKEWLKTIRQITDRNSAFPPLVIIEDLHTLSKSTGNQTISRDTVASFIENANQTTYAVVGTYTLSNKINKEEKENNKFWKKYLYSGTNQLKNFNSYWDEWQPFFFEYLKWMAPAILSRKVPDRWKDIFKKKQIFLTYRTPWSFVVGLGYLKVEFQNEFLRNSSDPLAKVIYLFLHIFFICTGEKPIRIDTYQDFLKKSLKDLLPETKYTNLEQIIPELEKYDGYYSQEQGENPTTSKTTLDQYIPK